MERIFKIPENTFDASLLFTETDPETQEALLAEEEQQYAAQMEVWEKILGDKRLIAFSFTQNCDCPLTFIFHPSTRPGVNRQLSRFSWDGLPLAHHDYRCSYMGGLLEELMDYSRVGGLVRVILED